jgi:hypothetical protein
VFSFTTDKYKDSVLNDLSQSGGAITFQDIVSMLDMCQIATCHSTGERYVRQLGYFVERGGVLKIRDVATGQISVVDDLEKLRALIRQRDSALDIANNLNLRPARE